MGHNPLMTENRSGRAGSLPAALARGAVVLDGGLSTELERIGHDLSGRMWSARLLRDAPGAVLAAHRSFVAAGAQVVTTASYQASFEGFAAQGLDRTESVSLFRRSVTLAREAASDDDADRNGPGPVWVAASVGPYGAVLGGGQEYRGDYVDPFWSGRDGGGMSVDELRRFHRPRLEVLASAGPDVLACETVPALAEAEALVAELAALEVPGWLSLTTVTDAHGRIRTRRGEDVAEAFALARDVPQVIAVGVNCTDPRQAGPAVRLAAEVSGKPVVVYPNSGESWDTASHRWYGAPGFATEDVLAWQAAGARLIGGCCRVGPEQVAGIARAVQPVAERSRTGS
jgi:homocysteine S-methyltransferase